MKRTEERLDLNDITIMRYAHVFKGRSSGGVEQYLRSLNTSLLQRHRLTIIQTYLEDGPLPKELEIERIGQGQIIWVPICFRHEPWRTSELLRRLPYLFRRIAELERYNHVGWWKMNFARFAFLMHHQAGHLRHKVVILSDYLSDMLNAYHVDLLVVHWCAYDTERLVAKATREGVPAIFINHFDNARLNYKDVLRVIRHISVIGTVSGQNIPQELKSRCTNMSDGLDTSFFRSDVAFGEAHRRPIILLPSRIAIGKGHYDLLLAAQLLVANAIDFEMWFVGAVESKDIFKQLCSMAESRALAGRVHIYEEQNAEELRLMYSKCSVVALPSYSEGLGRVLLEAQAMTKPVVAYDCGGVAEAMLPGKSGFLIPVGDVVELAAKIEYLLRNDSRRTQMGNTGRAFICQRFGLLQMIDRHEKFYLSVLNNSPNGLLKSDVGQEVS